MGTVTTLGLIKLAVKLGIAFGCGIGVCWSVNWFNKKTFKRKGGDFHAIDHDSTATDR